MYLPPIGTTGIFTFDPPFNVSPYIERVIKVISIRSLEELQKDGVDPLNNIYLKMKMTEEEYNNDYNSSVPIIVFKTKSSKFLYVPCNKINGMPKVDGVPYVRKVVMVNLGSLPTTINLNNLEQAIKDTTMEYLGIQPETTISDSSEVTLIDKSEHQQFMAKLNTTPFAQNNKPYSLRYQELQNKYDELRVQYDAINKFMARTWTNNVVNSNRPTPADLEIYTKRCVIDMVAPLGRKAGVNSILFYKRNSFDLDPKAIFVRGLSQDISNSLAFSGVIDKSNVKVELTEGDITNQNIPDVFSDLCYVEFNKDTTNNESRAKLDITFSDKINIRDMSLRPALSNEVHCSKVRVMLFNEAGTMIYSVSFSLGTHFSVTESQGLSQFLKIEDMQLQTSIPQTPPPPLQP